MGDQLIKAAKIGVGAAILAALAMTGFSQKRTAKRPAPQTITAKGVASTQSPSLTGPGTGNLKLRAAFDYDGDGKADFTVFRPSDGNWYVKKSGGGTSLTPFGNPTTDYMTPGDYDGD